MNAALYFVSLVRFCLPIFVRVFRVFRGSIVLCSAFPVYCFRFYSVASGSVKPSQTCPFLIPCLQPFTTINKCPKSYLHYVACCKHKSLQIKQENTKTQKNAKSNMLFLSTLKNHPMRLISPMSKYGCCISRVVING